MLRTRLYGDPQDRFLAPPDPGCVPAVLEQARALRHLLEPPSFLCPIRRDGRSARARTGGCRAQARRGPGHLPFELVGILRHLPCRHPGGGRAHAPQSQLPRARGPLSARKLGGCSAGHGWFESGRNQPWGSRSSSPRLLDPSDRSRNRALRSPARAFLDRLAGAGPTF